MDARAGGRIIEVLCATVQTPENKRHK